MIINDLDDYYIVFDTKNRNIELDTLAKNLTFLPPCNLTDVTVKKFTRGKNLNFHPPWGDTRGALKALLSALLTTANPQDGMKLPLHPRCCP